MKFLFHAMISLMLSAPLLCRAQTRQLTTKDLSVMIGVWNGSLTYVDYTSGKRFSMPADLQVWYLPNSKKFVLSNKYPQEPHANSADTIEISEDGYSINKKRIVSIQNTGKNELTVVTEENGMDGNDNKAAIIRLTFMITDKSFKKTKEVKFDGEPAWILRSEYFYQRNLQQN